MLKASSRQSKPLIVDGRKHVTDKNRGAKVYHHLHISVSEELCGGFMHVYEVKWLKWSFYRLGHLDSKF